MGNIFGSKEPTTQSTPIPPKPEPKPEPKPSFLPVTLYIYSNISDSETQKLEELLQPHKCNKVTVHDITNPKLIPSSMCFIVKTTDTNRPDPDAALIDLCLEKSNNNCVYVSIKRQNGNLYELPDHLRIPGLKSGIFLGDSSMERREVLQFAFDFNGSSYHQCDQNSKNAKLLQSLVDEVLK